MANWGNQGAADGKCDGGECDGNECETPNIYCIIPCLPKICAAMAQKQTKPEDALGWEYLKEMFEKWLANDNNADPKKYIEPYDKISWDWIMKFPRAKQRYDAFTRIGGNTFEDEGGNKITVTPNIYSEASENQIFERLVEQGYIANYKGGVESFDFAAYPVEKWSKVYFNSITVSGFGINFTGFLSIAVDGLMAVFASFTLRSLAKGTFQKLEDGRWKITVTAVYVYAQDVFNFEGDNSLVGYGSWSCKKLDGAVGGVGDKSYIKLTNLSFNIFREKGKGGDFLVLSNAHKVEDFVGMTYDK